MENNMFIITGCQRSGTTLLKLILDAHPNIQVIDEDEVGHHGESVTDYLNGMEADFKGFKLPMISNELEKIKGWNNPKVLFIIRHPYDVISSMLKLKIDFGVGHPQIKLKYFLKSRFLISNTIKQPVNFIQYILILSRLKRNYSLPWAFHPDCIDAELINSVDPDLKEQLKIKDFIDIHPMYRNKAEAIYYCSYVWVNKNKIIEKYSQNGIKYLIVGYEELLTNTENELKKICDFLNISYNEEMLLFYTKKTGYSIGNTKNDNPIITNNYNKWHTVLNRKELKVIKEICNDTAKKFEYSL